MLLCAPQTVLEQVWVESSGFCHLEFGQEHGELSTKGSKTFSYLLVTFSKVNFKSYLNVGQTNIRLGALGATKPAARRK